MLSFPWIRPIFVDVPMNKFIDLFRKSRKDKAAFMDDTRELFFRELAVELADAAGLGVSLDVSGTAALFGEDQARYLIVVAPSDVDTVLAAANEAGVPARNVGSVGGDQVAFGDQSRDLAGLSAAYRSAFANSVG